MSRSTSIRIFLVDGTPDGPFTYKQLVERGQVNLDMVWLKDDSHLDAEDLPEPDVLVDENMEYLRAALGEFEELAAELDGVA